MQAIIAECGGGPGEISNVIKTEWSVAFLAARRTNTAMKIMIDLHENLFSREVENRSRRPAELREKQTEMRIRRV